MDKSMKQLSGVVVAAALAIVIVLAPLAFAGGGFSGGSLSGSSANGAITPTSVTTGSVTTTSLTASGTSALTTVNTSGTATFNSTANFTSAVAIGSAQVESATLPTLSGFCTSPSIVTHGTWTFDINVGSSCATNTGTINFPANGNGWNCTCYNATTTTSLNQITVGAGTNNSVPLTQVVKSTNGAANWGNADHLRCICAGW